MIYVKGNVERIAGTPEAEATLKARGYVPYKGNSAPMPVLREGNTPPPKQEEAKKPAQEPVKKRRRTPRSKDI